jgi:diguanylate cyclase (GGDEF)-like protein
MAMAKQSIHLLLVEDNIDQRELTLRSFRKKLPEVQITAVENGPASLQKLGEERYDAVILDYSLPMLNGLEVLKLIQERGYLMPVVMVTGQGDEKLAVEAMKRGAYDYIIKTQNYHETLPMVVEKVIEKYQLKRHLEEATSRAHLLYEVSLAVATERKVAHLGDRLVQGAKELVHAKAAILALLDSEGSVQSIAVSELKIDPETLQGPLSRNGLFGLAYTELKPCVLDSVEGHPLWSATPAHEPPIRELLTLPFIREGKVTGVLTVINKEEGFSQEDLDTLMTLAVHSTLAVENARFLEETERMAVTDGLTGLYNHKEFQKRLAEEVERGSRYGKEFSLLMMDIDHFKVFNDTHGHPVGDAILKEIVKITKKCIRTVDIAARYGGEEFAIILPETNAEGGKIVAERIRQSIDDSPFSTPDGHRAHLSVSIGLSLFPSDASKREELIIAADEALYFAKNAGRNRICPYSETLKSAIEKDRSVLEEMLRDPKMKTIRDLAAAIDAKSPYTRGHTEGVIQYALLLAEGLNLSDDEKESLQIASLLHNIGTVGIPDTLLNKPGPLTDEEKKIIHAHPGFAQMLIEGSMKLESVLPAVLYHHERYDGQGYPNGLRGEEIPYLARVLGVAEAYHAMISVRSYRPKLTREEAIDELKKNAGTQFDARVVEIFIAQLNANPPSP